MKTIRFKSWQDNWKKEYSGMKSNTVRRFTDYSDHRLELLNDFISENMNLLTIEIENDRTGEIFSRKVTDVTNFEENYIISWRSNHE